MQKNIKVLYINGVGPFGGACRSLFETVKQITQKDVSAYFISAKGTSNDFYQLVAEDMILVRALSRFDNTEYSYYRGFRWLVLLREIFNAPSTFLSVFKAKKKWKSFDIIHVNEITQIFTGLLASKIFNAPLVVHVRSVQRVGSSFRNRIIEKALKKAAGIIAIDLIVERSLPKSINSKVIHNSFTINETLHIDQKFRDKISKIDNKTFKVGYVGNFLELKGIKDLFDAAVLVKKQNVNVKFLIVGDETTPAKGIKQIILKSLGVAQNVKNTLLEDVEKHGLKDEFLMLGATKDIIAAYESFDVLCFPSHLDAPGRPVFEAAFFEVPSIVAVSKPTEDTLVDGVTGIAIPAKNVNKLAEVIIKLASAPHLVSEMGHNAKKLAEQNYDPVKNAERVLKLYTKILDKKESCENRLEHN